ncbi:hypothetical protein OEZ85_014361 [Tetradesmus obliquus]|uniref:Apple domain-containing protein n=1 Tax=Tetradesmus obliquus TaxID=3088 RepID=A0ABY8U843_TETOB|nr:hypothetical protein OEZ85_014361 [Tetradesmus obliquus]
MGSWQRACWCLAFSLAAVQLAHAACPTLTIDFFPSDTENVPEGWTKAAQVAAGNEDSSSLNTISLTAKPTPKLYVQPEHPLFKRGSLTAAYDVLYNIDGGIDKKATMPKQGPPYISLSTLDTLAPGKHTLNVKVTMLKGSAEVNSVASLQPSTDQLFTTKVNFNLVDKLPAGAAAAAAAAVAPAAAAVDKPAAPAAAAAAEDEPAAPPAPKPGTGGKNVTNALDDNPKPEPAIDDAVTQQAVKYYCMRQYNVGGKIHSQKEVPVGDEGIMACSVACNALGSNCGGFGLTGKKCFLMKAFNTNSSAADATIDALCMKSPNDWLDFGMRNAGLVGSGFFCLRGFDLKGDPAGSGDAENPVQTTTTEVAGMTPSTCATTCKATVGCQFMLMKKPTVAGGTATCYLKMHALGGLYGSTGPSKEVDYTCFNGQEAWMTFGGQLDFALPSPEVNTGVETPAVAAIAPIGVNATGKTYRCIKGYSIGGATLKRATVSLGDEGLTQCAAKCDEESGACVAYVMGETGTCNLLKAISFNTTAADSKTYGLCFSTASDWNKFGNPDSNGMYCIKNYDFAGDGVRTVDYITIATGTAAVNFCKQQCIAEPLCQYSVTSLGKCYMKTNILSGSFGTTRPDTAVDASCVKGESNWALAALQVAASTQQGAGAGGRTGMNARRAAIANQNAAGALAAPLPLQALAVSSLACIGACLLLL